MPPKPQFDSSQTVDLNCFIDGDEPSDIFTIEIPLSKNVAQLRSLIKQEKFLRFKHVEPSNIVLFLVSFPLDRLAEMQPPTGSTPLISAKRMSSLFSGEHNEEILHIWVKAPPGMSPQCFFGTFFM